MNQTTTVLLVDDNFINRRLVAAMLHGEPYCLVERESGREGLAYALAQHDSLDLILLDIGMPDLGGIEICRAIREHEGEGRRLPIIAYTAHAMAEERRAFVDAGFDDIIIKPITRDQFLPLIDRHLTGAAPWRADTLCEKEQQ